jgi:hypothetical protein
MKTRGWKDKRKKLEKKETNKICPSRKNLNIALAPTVKLVTFLYIPHSVGLKSSPPPPHPHPLSFQTWNIDQGYQKFLQILRMKSFGVHGTVPFSPLTTKCRTPCVEQNCSELYPFADSIYGISNILSFIFCVRSIALCRLCQEKMSFNSNLTPVPAAYLPLYPLACCQI